jgi:hypothetical protein
MDKHLRDPNKVIISSFFLSCFLSSFLPSFSPFSPLFYFLHSLLLKIHEREITRISIYQVSLIKNSVPVTQSSTNVLIVIHSYEIQKETNADVWKKRKLRLCTISRRPCVPLVFIITWYEPGIWAVKYKKENLRRKIPVAISKRRKMGRSDRLDVVFTRWLGCHAFLCNDCRQQGYG